MGVTVQQCLDFGRTVARPFPIPFLYMTYYNIVFKYGVARFADHMNDAGLRGAIVPDLPPEEGRLSGCHGQKRVAPIFIFSPTTPDARMETISKVAGGFVYCVARKGVTGDQTDFSRQLASPNRVSSDWQRASCTPIQRHR
jgi:tryptophan synthase alpha chain